jgi:hypothetical protein
MEDIINYEDGDIYYLLLEGKDAAAVMEEWYRHDFKCDLVIHKSRKNPGKTIIETKTVMLADMVKSMFGYAKVSIKKKGKKQ